MKKKIKIKIKIKIKTKKQKRGDFGLSAKPGLTLLKLPFIKTRFLPLVHNYLVLWSGLILIIALPFSLNGESGTGDRMIMQGILDLVKSMGSCIVPCTSPIMGGTKLLAILPTPFHLRYSSDPASSHSATRFN